MTVATDALKNVIAGLYVVESGSFDPAHLDKCSVVINMTDNKDLFATPKNMISIFWDNDIDVDAKVFEGVVRLCASSIKGARQKVVLVGKKITIYAISACVVREYLGCDSDTAIGIIKSVDSNAITNSAIIETVWSYKLS